MESLREIILFLDRYILKKVDLLDPTRSRNGANKYAQLMDGIRTGRYKSDAQAEQDLYGRESNGSKYRVLKSRLKDHLLGQMFFIDVASAEKSPYLQASYICQREYFCATFLMRYGGGRIATSLAKSAFTRARKYQLTDIALQCARLLRNRFSWLGIRKEFDFYNAEIYFLQGVQHAETRAEEFLDSLRLEQRITTAHKPELAPQARRFAEEVDRARAEFNTFRLHMLYFDLSRWAHQLINDYASVLAICRETERYLQCDPLFCTPARKAEWIGYKILCCIALRKYDDGLQFADEALALRRAGSDNWFITLELYFLLAMHARKFDIAADLYTTVADHKRFKSLPQHTAEKWIVYESYLSFVCESGWMDELSQRMPANIRSRLRTNVHVKETPLYSKDKRGLNAAILISQILHLLAEKRYDDITDKMDALQRYNRRYLTSENNARAHYFFRMLALMEHCSFDPITTKKLAAKWYNRLCETTIDTSIEGLEVTPYEILWERILKLLAH